MQSRDKLVLICYTLVIFIIGYMVCLYHEQLFQNAGAIFATIVSVSTFLMTVFNFQVATKERKFARRIEQNRIKELRKAVNVFRNSQKWNQDLSLTEDDIDILQVNINYILQYSKSFTIIRTFKYINLILIKIKNSNNEISKRMETNGLVEYVKNNIFCMKKKEIY
ncbi:hypothetical protein [Limosilactobacillus caccae]|uniref:hypothetical protein n=1 Tax=Limosilactobacillus caccae TaxID=1926284 RepID=UPI0009705DFD|nr:hypothetical protein [Limosilactobacillus caccae]